MLIPGSWATCLGDALEGKGWRFRTFPLAGEPGVRYVMRRVLAAGESVLKRRSCVIAPADGRPPQGGGSGTRFDGALWPEDVARVWGGREMVLALALALARVSSGKGELSRADARRTLAELWVSGQLEVPAEQRGGERRSQPSH